MLSFKVSPSDLDKLYWTRTYHDLRSGISLMIQSQMKDALARTEAMVFVAGKLFGSKSSGAITEDLRSTSDMRSFADFING